MTVRGDDSLRTAREVGPDAITLDQGLLESGLPEPKRKILRSLAHGDPTLLGKKVLVVDDEVRNILAITALLEQRGVEVVSAEKGRRALERCYERPDVDAVLIDIMMPEMHGHEATREIHRRPGGSRVAGDRADREGDGGRSREAHRGREPRTT